MANMCINWVEIKGSEEDVRQVIELVGKEFDFSKVIPVKDDSGIEANNKWGCSSIAFDAEFDQEIEEEACWGFCTKWNAPALIYKALCEKFPNVFIYWRYEEPDNNLYGYLQNE